MMTKQKEFFLKKSTKAQHNHSRAAVWETLQSTPLIFSFPTKSSLSGSSQSLTLSGQLISSFCNISSTKQEISNILIERHEGAEMGSVPYIMALGVREAVQILETLPAPYTTKSILNEVVSFQQETNRLPLIEFFKWLKIAASISG